MDLLDIDDLEFEFMNLVKQGFSKEMFSRNAEIMLGEGWEKDGREMIAGHYPELLSKFDKYIGK